LLNTLNLIGFLGDLNGTCKLGGTTTSNNFIAFNHVSYYANGIKEASLGFITNGS